MKITISMDQATVDTLMNTGSFLYGFKVVGCQDKSCRPLVWFRTREYSCNTYVPWDKEYQAYLSFNPVAPMSQITVLVPCPIEPGQTMYISKSDRYDVTVCEGGVKDGISIQNKLDTSFTIGISQRYNGDHSPGPICAVPLSGHNLQIIAPIERVMLWFSPQNIRSGRVIERAYNPGILIDLKDSPERAVHYDQDKGWSWGGFPWAESIESGSNIVDRLIIDLPFQPPSSS
ncbi:hypothetical protein [Polyangium sorediatum]|uniref:Uncharacterized protein n=1 Tax=Polyangium sorediatum TaxID=889274 RepID=A0ABT6PA16_9BACT|nr:hypothetical protein [Polyangium sorediatum]MDI1437452.1 hypothetical protein [Polyangium sorediatum]